MSPPLALPLFILGTLGLVLAAGLLVFIMIGLFRVIGAAIGWTFRAIGAVLAHLGRFVAGMFRDTFRAVGAILAAVVLAVLSTLSVVIGRWSAAGHFASNMTDEFSTCLACIYRVTVGHPLRLVGLGSMLEGIEHRVPAALADAPGPDRPARRTGRFEGYEIVGSLPGGGSGGRLHVAKSMPATAARLEKQFGFAPERVVIKSFAVADGSSLPQIVRESRALEAARSVGLILEHELGPDRFHYVMEYVPGENLGALVRRHHADSTEGAGLDDRRLRLVLGYVADLLETLDGYHRAGLWHKDVKPENVIVSDDRAHVVDLGLVTPLRSAMTLTTHGTEYFRDPEMVRMALKGVKVHEVDGVKFDVYAVGAVLYYAIENTFPSHGGLSTITKRCPETVKWIIRRAMADYQRRYETADAMLADLRAVLDSRDLHRLTPAALPSVGAGTAGDGDGVASDEAVAAGPAPMPGPEAAEPRVADRDRERRRRVRPHIAVASWWTGKYVVTGTEHEDVRADRADRADRRGDARSGRVAERVAAIKSAASDASVRARRAADRVRDSVEPAVASVQRAATPIPPVAPVDEAEPVRAARVRPAHHRARAAEQIRTARRRARATRERAATFRRRHDRKRGCCFGGRQAHGENVTSPMAGGVLVAASLIVAAFIIARNDDGAVSADITMTKAPDAAATPGPAGNDALVVERHVTVHLEGRDGEDRRFEIPVPARLPALDFDEIRVRGPRATDRPRLEAPGAPAPAPPAHDLVSADLRARLDDIRPRTFVLLVQHPRYRSEAVGAAEAAIESAMSALGFIRDADQQTVARAAVTAALAEDVGRGFALEQGPGIVVRLGYDIDAAGGSGPVSETFDLRTWIPEIESLSGTGEDANRIVHDLRACLSDEARRAADAASR